MDVLREREYRIYFGGSYKEKWDEDYHLSLEYRGRSYVTAVPGDEGWTVSGGDEYLCALLKSPACPPFTRLYFNAAAEVCDGINDCLRRKLTLDRLYECFKAGSNPLIAPELMRSLMDDCGFSMNDAYLVTLRCCQDCRAMGVDASQLYPLQPRTAHVVSILRQLQAGRLVVEHDSSCGLYRRPFGAVRCSEAMELGIRVLSGRVESASLVLYGDKLREEYPMERKGDMLSVSLEAPDSPAALWYLFKIETEDSCHWLCPDESGYRGRLYSGEKEGFRLTVYLPDFETPQWFRACNMYQIFPDRFGFSARETAEKGIEYHRNLGQQAELHANIDEPVRWQPRAFETAYSPDDFYGGTIQGIIDKLPYIKELGMDCIYLNPIVEARSNHRYDASDYMKLDPILGSNEDFGRLAAECGKLGMRLVLDGVFSHTGADSVYFNRYGNYDSLGACQGKKSPYYTWYDFKRFPNEYRSWWGFEDLPEVEETNPSWQDFVITGEQSVVKTWLRRGAGGWRLDVADELPDETLGLIRKAAREVCPDALILGEVWEDAVIKESLGGRRNYALGYSLDSVMNYPLRSAVLDFAHFRTDAYQLRDFLISQQMNYPKPMYYCLMNLLGSHDMERLRSNLAVDVVIKSLSREEQLKLNFSPAALERALVLEKLCAELIYSLPGMPSLYYGDEQGMCGVSDPFNRQPFKEGERELHDFYAHIAKRRKANAVLQTGQAQFAACSADVLTVLRYVTNGADAFGIPCENGAYLTVINRGGEEARYTADCSATGIGNVSGSIAPMSAETIRLF